MADLLEIGDIIFNKTDVEDMAFEPQATTILYGTALTNSENGMVTVQIDDAYYDADDALPPVKLARKGYNDPAEVYHQPLRDYGWTATLYADHCLS